ncbi:hypothetical protein EVAR_8389_1 [Eumeta japonica]|uniref:Uncharacterized protein n=1 Tax=Eumeta variegata TaxID=151549 RepID=A0A4C1VF34_EUMVA|nr:hypothetical protein EVAR_8389_1 [Eumeta japonica]
MTRALTAVMYNPTRTSNYECSTNGAFNENISTNGTSGCVARMYTQNVEVTRREVITKVPREEPYTVAGERSQSSWSQRRLVTRNRLQVGVEV